MCNAILCKILDINNFHLQYVTKFLSKYENLNTEISFDDIIAHFINIYNKEIETELQHNRFTIEQIYTLIVYLEIEKDSTKLSKLGAKEIEILGILFENLFFGEQYTENNSCVERKNEDIASENYFCEYCARINNDLNKNKKEQQHKKKLGNIIDSEKQENNSILNGKNNCCSEIITQLEQKIIHLENKLKNNKKHKKNEIEENIESFRVDRDIIKRFENEIVCLKNQSEIENDVIYNA